MDAIDARLRRALAELPRLLAAAPHRLPFLAGAAAVLLAMGWWATVLVRQRWGAGILAATPLPPGWGHALTMQYQVLALFVFGFLLTVFPRWFGQAPFAARHYLPVGGALLAGYVATLVGLAGSAALLHLGVVLTLAGWGIGTSLLLTRFVVAERLDTHAAMLLVALLLGAAGLVLVAAFLHGGDARLAFAAIKIGSFGLLLPIYFTVTHRMVPFFASCVVPGYRLVRPTWALLLGGALAFAHLLLELLHAYAALWPVDLVFAALAGGLWLAWRPAVSRGTPLLAVLFAAYAWLPVALLLYAGQSAWFAATGAFALGRAPAHALAVGFFGSMLVAMVTRVTQGHSGRPLAMTATAWFAFFGVQAVALLRIAAELLPDAPAWQAVAAIGWLLAFLPWALRAAWVCLTPRVDGRPG